MPPKEGGVGSQTMSLSPGLPGLMVHANKKTPRRTRLSLARRRHLELAFFRPTRLRPTRALRPRVAIFPHPFPMKFLWKNDNSRVVSICKNDLRRITRERGTTENVDPSGRILTSRNRPVFTIPESHTVSIITGKRAVPTVGLLAPGGWDRAGKSPAQRDPCGLCGLRATS